MFPSANTLFVLWKQILVCSVFCCLSLTFVLTLPGRWFVRPARHCAACRPGPTDGAGGSVVAQEHAGSVFQRLPASKRCKHPRSRTAPPGGGRRPAGGSVPGSLGLRCRWIRLLLAMFTSEIISLQLDPGAVKITGQLIWFLCDRTGS